MFPIWLQDFWRTSLISQQHMVDKHRGPPIAPQGVAMPYRLMFFRHCSLSRYAIPPNSLVQPKGEGGSGYCSSSSPLQAIALREGGVRLYSIANRHMMSQVSFVQQIHKENRTLVKTDASDVHSVDFCLQVSRDAVTLIPARRQPILRKKQRQGSSTDPVFHKPLHPCRS